MSETPRREVAPIEWIALAVILIVGALLRFGHPGVGYFNIHAARDCFRALEMLRGEAFHFAGSEMLYGGRTIGWFHYLQLMVPLAVSPSPISVMLWLATLQTAALVLTFVMVRRFFGTATALGTTALFAVAPVNLTMMRYMWNPAFLPFYHVLGLFFLWHWRCERRGWAFGAWLVMFGLAFQIHFSAALHLIGALALRPWQPDRRPGWRPIGIALLVLAPFFVPQIVDEAFSGTNTRAIFAEDPRGFLQGSARTMLAPEINPTAVPQLMRHLRVDLGEGIEFTHRGETVTAPNMTNFVHFMEALSERGMGDNRMWRFIEQVAWVQVLLFGAGLTILLIVLLNRPRSWAERLCGLWRHPEAARDISLMLLLWFALSFGLLMFLRFEDIPYWRVVPGRYFQVWYPLHLLVMILGLRGLIAIAFTGRRRIPHALAVVLLFYLFTTQQSLMFIWLGIKQETGVAFYYTGRPEHEIANVGDKVRLAELLVGEEGLTLEGFRERTSTAGRYAIGDLGEETIDYELRAQPGFLTNPPASPEIHWHITSVDAGLPFPEEKIEVLAVHDVGQLRAITFRVTDPEFIIPRQLLENNYIW